MGVHWPLMNVCWSVIQENGLDAQKREDCRVMEERRSFEDDAFISWRKDFDASGVAGVTVEVKISGIRYEITYERIIH